MNKILNPETYQKYIQELTNRQTQKAYFKDEKLYSEIDKQVSIYVITNCEEWKISLINLQEKIRNYREQIQEIPHTDKQDFRYSLIGIENQIDYLERNCKQHSDEFYEQHSDEFYE